MSTISKEFNQYKLSTELSEGCWKHTIACGSGERIEKWRKDKKLGKGGGGTVWLEKEESGIFRAVKKVSKTKISMSSRELLALIKLKEYPQHFVQFSGWFESESSIHLVMEYIEHGDLHDFIHQVDTPVAGNDAKTITRQLLEGLRIMHENLFCHRDLKPRNILMASLSPIIVKISDFDVSKNETNETALRTMVGTSGYMAPEIRDDYFYSKTSVYTNAVDIWSLGCLIHEIMTKETPFSDGKTFEDYVLGRILFPRTILIEKGASSTAIKFINSLLTPLPEERLTAEQALKSPWLAAEDDIQEWEEEDTWAKMSDQMAAVNFDLGRDRILSDLREVNKSPDRLVDVSTKPALHDCTTLYCAVTHENIDVVKRLCRDDPAKVNAKQPGNKDGWTALHLAAHHGLYGVTKLLLENGASVMAKDNLGWTALHVTAREGHEEVATLLLENGADVMAGGKDEWTALHRTAHYGQPEMAKLLLKNGASVMAKDNGGWTALHVTAREGHEEVAKLLLENGADVMAKGKDEWTALHRAAHFGRLGMARLLLEKKADTAAKDRGGSTPLAVAAEIGHEVLVKLLLEKGADTTAKDGLGSTALHLAAQNGHEVVTKLLLENKANTMTKDKNGRTALHLAADVGREGTAKLLVESGAGIMTKDNLGWTALHLTAREGHEEVAKLLIENEADVTARGKDRWTALHRAAHFGQEGIAELLLENGADIMARDRGGWTALHVAAGRGQEALVEFLLENGADIMAGDDSGSTALHMAAQGGHEETAKLLLEHGADILAKDNDGRTALRAAAENGYGTLVELLLEKKADITVKDSYGWTALHVAAQKKHTVVTNLLLEAESAMDQTQSDAAVKEDFEEVETTARKSSTLGWFRSWFFGK